MVSRIKQLLDWQQLSPTQFADRIGVGRPVVSHILSERNKPSLDVVRNIKKTFPELSLDWLLDGTGDMLAATPFAATSLPLATSAAPIAPAIPVAPAVASISAEQPAPAGTTAPAAPILAVPSTAVPARPAAPPPPAARFRPGGVAPSATQVIVPSPPPASVPPVELALPVEPVWTAPAGVLAHAAGPDVAPLAQTMPVPPPAVEPLAPAPAADLAAGFAEPGKPIRRIVIFYRDGSFADYQPEG